MLDFIGVEKSYGDQDIFVNATFRINKNEAVGVVGPNGTGKSTLFSILTGEVEPDRGTINLPKNTRIGYLHQQLKGKHDTVTLLDFVSDAIPELKEITAKIHELEAVSSPDLKRLGDLQSKFESLDGYNIRTNAEMALSGLGFHVDDFSRKLSEFSGGWQMRAALARVIISNSDILLLDEPSNYLDIPAIEWLQRFLKTFKGTLLLISHDRYLLKSLTNITLEINAGVVTRYPGDYDYYTRERENRTRLLIQEKKNQDKKREQLQRSIDRFRSKNTKAAQVQSWIKEVDKMPEIVLPQSLTFKNALKLPEPPHCGNEVIRVENGSFSYDGENWIWENIDFSVNNGDKVAFIGYNGTGKTTLIRTLAGVSKLSKGNVVVGHNVVVGYQAQEFSEILPPELSVYDVVKAVCSTPEEIKKLRNLLGGFGFTGEQIEKPCKVLSGGEKIRLCFARIFAKPPNLLILDEPTTHLDIASRESLQRALKEYKGTLCLVSHDIEFVSDVAETIISMENKGIRKYYGNYDYYIEKSQQFSSENRDVPTKSSESDDDSKKSAKQQRKERAEHRQSLQKEKKSAEQKVNRLEKEIEALELEKESIHEALLGQGDMLLDYPTLNKKLHDVTQRIDALSEEWEQSAEVLEEILEVYNSIA